MSNNYRPEILDKEMVRRALERYYIRNTFDQDCTKLESGVCLLADGEANSLDLGLEENYCWQLKELMDDYHKYRQDLLTVEDQAYLEELIEIFEEESIGILEFDCGHFDITDGLHRLCIASNSEVSVYATYKAEGEICPICESIKERSAIINKGHLL